MWMKIYWIGIGIILLVWIIYVILFALEELIESERYATFVEKWYIVISIVLMVLFAIYNGWMLYQYPKQFLLKFVCWPYIVISIVALMITFFYFDNSNAIEGLENIGTIIGIIAFVIYVVALFLCATWGSDWQVEGEKTETISRYVYTIDIIEMEQQPYNNISGGRYYIRSAPSFAYYYKVTTESGNRTTKVLDGSQSYIEEDIDNQYQDNPHIDAFQLVEKYQTMYGEERERILREDYVICVPENSIYYETQ